MLSLFALAAAAAEVADVVVGNDGCGRGDDAAAAMGIFSWYPYPQARVQVDMGYP